MVGAGAATGTLLIDSAIARTGDFGAFLCFLRERQESRMTPQEQELVEELFDRLAKLQNSTRDPAAERVIADGLRRAPQATYALVQTAQRTWTVPLLARSGRE